jgi:Iron permease FTR1 family
MLTALLIMLREGFEAALVVAIVYAYIRRIGGLVAPMWQGMAAAAALSVAAGVVVHLTVENLQGELRLLAFAAVSLLAVVVLTWMIFWMRRQAHKIKGELRVYALGYQELTGESADLIEILNLDERASNVRDLVPGVGDHSPVSPTSAAERYEPVRSQDHASTVDQHDGGHLPRRQFLTLQLLLLQQGPRHQ